jgi:hypothetical protein
LVLSLSKDQCQRFFANLVRAEPNPFGLRYRSRAFVLRPFDTSGRTAFCVACRQDEALPLVLSLSKDQCQRFFANLVRAEPNPFGLRYRSRAFALRPFDTFTANGFLRGMSARRGLGSIPEPVRFSVLERESV